MRKPEATADGSRRRKDAKGQKHKGAAPPINARNQVFLYPEISTNIFAVAFRPSEAIL